MPFNLTATSFSRGHMSGSINVPFSTAFGTDDEVLQCPATGALQNYRGRVVVVIGHAMKSASAVRLLPPPKKNSAQAGNLETVPGPCLMERNDVNSVPILNRRFEVTRLHLPRFDKAA